MVTLPIYAGIPWGLLPLPALLVAVISYLLGSFNGAVIVSKYILRDDVRNHGSGNAGLTNFYRTFGGPLTLVVILTDVMKGVIAVLAGVWLAGMMAVGIAPVLVLARYWAGLFCLVGHMFPWVFHFKGGKGILTGGTVVLMMDWRVALVAWAIFLALAILTKWVSLGSICAAASFPVMTALVYRDIAATVLAALIGGLIIWKHRENLGRIVKGTESKFTLHPNREEKP